MKKAHDTIFVVLYLDRGGIRWYVMSLASKTGGNRALLVVVMRRVD